MALRCLRIAERLHANWITLAAALSGGLVGIALDLARPWPIKVIVDYALFGYAVPPGLGQLLFTSSDPPSRARIIVLAAIAGAVITVAGAALAYFTRIAVFGVAQEMVVDLAHEVFGKLQRQSLDFHDRHELGDLVQRSGADVFAIHSLINSVAFPAVLATASIVGMVLLMLRLDVALTVVTASVIPLLAAVALVFNGPFMRAFNNQWREQGSLMGFLQQSLGGIRAVQADAREAYVLERFLKHGNELGAAYRDSLRIGARYNQATAVVTGLVGVSLTWYGAIRVMDHTLTLGDLLVFLGYLAMVNGPITTLASALTTWMEARARATRLAEILDAGDEVPECPNPVVPHKTAGTVTFDRVTFAYRSSSGQEPTRVVLKEVSFETRRGEVTAVIGLTGAGKSSLLRLLSRFHDPTFGAIALDGVDLRDLKLRFLRENVAVVLQDPILFPISVAANIGFGRPDATRAEIVAAARLSHADQFIRALPAGYDTILSEGGVTLSGGERQRISLARAIVKDAPILVLDEPTSSLDAHTEGEILRDLSKYCSGRTTFIISHRLTTIRGADQIIALEDGRVRERGRHEELLGSDGIYSRLFNAQTLAAV